MNLVFSIYFVIVQSSVGGFQGQDYFLESVSIKKKVEVKRIRDVRELSDRQKAVLLKKTHHRHILEHITKKKVN